MHVTSNMDAAWPSEGDDSAVRGITGTHRYEFPFRISKKKKHSLYFWTICACVDPSRIKPLLKTVKNKLLTYQCAY